MQMIYLLHSTFDQELMGKLRRRFGATFGGPISRPAGDKSVNDNAAPFELDLTEDELTEDLEFGRVA
ncbi:MAG: hypothetical protein WBG86_03020 [Polyangiales bacterium]